MPSLCSASVYAVRFTRNTTQAMCLLERRWIDCCWNVRVRVFILETERLRARILDFGATLMSLEAPDRHGRRGDVVLGFDDPERYRGAHPHFGGIVGRYANRIAGGRFELDGKSY